MHLSPLVKRLPYQTSSRLQILAIRPRSWRDFHCGQSLHDNAQRSRVVFSGIQPTGIPHLGNYLGALRPWVEQQNVSGPHDTLIYSIVDLHSLTSQSQSAADRRKAKLQMLATFLAIGLDPDRSILFYQSDVPFHTELHWILSCDASMGFLSRMNQWKSKLGNDGVAALLQPTANPRSQKRQKLGLFSYPVLQAADILLYRTTEVPVGEDQIQHIEFARNLATAFNATYGAGGTIGEDGRKQKGREILVPPIFKISPAKRVMSLTEPAKKMSKSDEQDKSRILLTDTEDIIDKKMKAALTDSDEMVTYDPLMRPGVSNLIEIISHLEGTGRSCESIASEFNDIPAVGSKMRSLKSRAAEVVNDHFAPIRERYDQIVHERGGRDLEELAHAGGQKAADRARKTIMMVRQATGIS